MIKEKKIKTAILAGGCFWCMVMPFDEYAGVLEVTSGYTGGQLKNPKYEEVKTQKSGHLEAVKIIYDENVISFQALLNIYWQQIDPTDDRGQFSDRGESYRTAIFFTDQEQKEIAQASKEKLAQSGKFDQPIVTRILEAQEFYLAEDYHQDFARKEPERYASDDSVQKRKSFIKEHWSKEDFD